MTEGEDAPGVWVFMGVRANHLAAVFSTLKKGEVWVRQHRLEGMLTWYPLDVSAYDWVMARGDLEPKSEHTSPEFLAAFSSAYQPHHHFENEDPS